MYVNGGKGADSGEGDVGGSRRAKNAGRRALLSPEYDPEHLPSSAACVRQKG